MSIARVVTKRRKGENEAAERLRYWLSRPPGERLAMVQELRAEYHGWEDGAMELDPDFREFIQCCQARDVRFLIVGGYALAAHGHPRYTKDLDVWVLVDPANADRLAGALVDFRFGSLGLTAEDFSKPGAVVQLGCGPRRIDILTTVDGVDFDDCHARRFELGVSGIAAPVPFINADDLKANKAATGRLQDLADIATLEGRER